MKCLFPRSTEPSARLVHGVDADFFAHRRPGLSVVAPVERRTRPGRLAVDVHHPGTAGVSARYRRPQDSR